MSELTRDLWLKAIADCQEQGDPSALTIAELSTLLEMPVASLQRRLLRMLAAGLVTKTTRRMHGRIRTAYRLVDPCL